MQEVNGRYVLEPKLTGFEASILMEMVDRKRDDMKRAMRERPADAASCAASYVEYDRIYEALKAEHDQWTEARGGKS